MGLERFVPVASASSNESFEQQQARLEWELAAAEARLAQARECLARLHNDVNEALRAELAATRETISAIEREHARAMALARGDARVAVVRILDDARERAAMASGALAGEPEAGLRWLGEQ